ncbi:signal peptidase II [Corynebacterium otitidis]
MPALMAVIGIAVAVADQASKAAVLANLEPGETVPLIGDWFRFRLVFNSGAAFSLGEDYTWLFSLIQLAFVVVIAVVSFRIRHAGQAVGLALIAGGALGNLIDRLFREPGFFLGHVVDFVSVGNFAIFNLADSAITVGVVVFLAAMIFEGEPGGGEPEPGRPAEEGKEQVHK